MKPESSFCSGGPGQDHQQPEDKKLHPQKEARAAGSSLRKPRRAMEALARFSLEKAASQDGACSAHTHTHTHSGTGLSKAATVLSPSSR